MYHHQLAVPMVVLVVAPLDQQLRLALNRLALVLQLTKLASLAKVVPCGRSLL